MNNNYKKYSMFLLLSILLTFMGSCFGFILGGFSTTLLLILSFTLIVIFSFSTGTPKKIFFTIFCFGEGIILSQIIYQCNMPMYIFTLSLLITVILVSIFLIIGLKCKNLSFLGGILFMGLLAIVIYSLISLFIPLPSIALLGIVIFSGYVSYDINKFKNEVEYNKHIDTDDILNHVMNMYLDVLNILLFVIQLLCDND